MVTLSVSRKFSKAFSADGNLGFISRHRRKFSGLSGLANNKTYYCRSYGAFKRKLFISGSWHFGTERKNGFHGFLVELLKLKLIPRNTAMHVRNTYSAQHRHIYIIMQIMKRNRVGNLCTSAIYGHRDK